MTGCAAGVRIIETLTVALGLRSSIARRRRAVRLGAPADRLQRLHRHERRREPSTSGNGRHRTKRRGWATTSTAGAPERQVLVVRAALEAVPMRVEPYMDTLTGKVAIQIKLPRNRV